MEGLPKSSDICKAEITFGDIACCFVQGKQHQNVTVCVYVHTYATTYTVMDCMVNSNQ